MHGNLEPEERVWGDQGLMDQIQTMIATLGWEMTDDIVLEVGGTSVYEIDGAGTKWDPCKGNSQV